MSRIKEAIWDALLLLEQQETNEQRCEGGCHPALPPEYQSELDRVGVVNKAFTDIFGGKQLPF